MEKNKILILQNDDIKFLGFSSSEYIYWVEKFFKMKYKSLLSSKISVIPSGNIFFTSMQSLLPLKYKSFTTKEVCRRFSIWFKFIWKLGHENKVDVSTIDVSLICGVLERYD